MRDSFKVIGIAGPIDLTLLNFQKEWNTMPSNYSFPTPSYFANYLVNIGYKVVIYTSSDKINKTVFYEDKYYKICVCSKKVKKALNDYIEDTEKIYSVMLEHPCDIICANWTYEFALAGVMSKKPTLVIMHDHAETIYNISPNKDKLYKKFLNEIVCNIAKKIIVVSPYLHTLLPEKLLQKSKILPNFFPSQLKEYFVDYSNKENYFISINNGFGKRKNVKVSIDSFVMFCQKNPDTNYSYHLIGDDMEDGGPAYKYALSINAPMSKFIFHGFLEHKIAMKILSRSKLLIHTSLEESFGMAVLESTIVGTPVLGGVNSGNIPNLLRNKGLLCNIEDKHQIYKMILMSVENKDYMSKISYEAFRLNVDLYNEEVITSNLMREMKSIYYLN